MHSTTIALAFAGLSAAQSTVSLFIPGADPQPLIASVIGSDTLATTYAVECIPGTDASDCGFAGGFILTAGPSTAAYTLSVGYENGTSSVLAFTGYIDCTLTGTTAGVCTESFGGNEANDPGMSTTTLEPSDITYMPVILTNAMPPNTDLGSTSYYSSAVITLTSASPSTTKGAATASNTSKSKSTSARKITSSTGSGSGTAIAQATGSTSSSTAGAAQAMITDKAQWLIGGAAVALAML